MIGYVRDSLALASMLGFVWMVCQASALVG
ncbi:MAG TPA: cell division inhibitor SidA [Caulobacteraceae bacterium]|jgi:hypothetical protein|nr:cell division inhibitor SidA [Caulobacteraceae bacterium]